MHECYRFTPNNESPRIMDCGANIGLASIYWKKIHPGARITAIEADPEVFAIMRKNFTEAGFRIHLHPELVSPWPFVQVRVDEGMDQRINIYAWRP